MRNQSANRGTAAGSVALGGLLAAAALVVMSLGGMIPIATYVCPVVCMIVLEVVRRLCGERIAWAWYGCVSLLGLLMCPDREAAFVFLFLGFYPILRPRLERLRFPVFWKALLFNGDVLLLYFILMHILGMDALQEEFREMGAVMVGVLLLLGNVTFFLLDLILRKRLGGIRKRGR